MTSRPVVAAVSSSPSEPFALQQVELLGPAADEVLLRLEACGVCHTDVEGRTALEPPCVVGHEGVGIIAALGTEVSDFTVGERVIASYPHCGACQACQEHRPYHCRDIIRLLFGGTRADGSATMAIGGQAVAAGFFQQSTFATHAVVPAASLVRAPAGLPPALLAALPCGVQTGAGAVLNALRLAPGDSLIVFGSGAVGLAAVMAAAARGVRDVVAVDVVDARLQLAQDLGAALTINARNEDVVAAVRARHPNGVRFALDTANVAATWTQAVECLAVGGVFGYVNVPQPDETFSVRVLPLFERFIKLHPIHNGEAVPRELLPELVRLRQAGEFPVDRLITTYAFDQIDQAFEDARRGVTVKPVLLMGGMQ